MTADILTSARPLRRRSARDTDSIALIETSEAKTTSRQLQYGKEPAKENAARSPGRRVMVEAAGIEPASENATQSGLHA